MTQTARKTGTAGFAVHMGNTLRRLAEVYPTLHEVVLESIQNALDANATRIDIVLDYHKRVLVAKDNGDGAGYDQFCRALQSVAESIKDETAMGRWALGLISPLFKCEQFTFTSCPKRPGTNPLDGTYLEFRFNSEELGASREVEGIPYTAMPHLRYCADQKKCGKHGQLEFVSWRSQLRISNFTTDRVIGRVRFDDLPGEVRDKFGVVLKKLGTVISVLHIDSKGTRHELTIDPPTFEGTAMPVWHTREADAGDCIFRLFAAPKQSGTRRGRINFGELNSTFRLTMNQFLIVVSDMLDPEIFGAFKAGYFNGEMLGHKIELAPNRKSFARNDALLGFCAAISQWWNEVGKAYVDQLQTQEQDFRFQETGLRALSLLDTYLDASGQREEVLGSLSIGTIGHGHTHRRAAGVQAQTSVSILALNEKRKPGPPQVESGPVPTVERLGHAPMTVTGPRGKARTYVKHGSTGIQLQYSELLTSDIYAFDSERGILEFNVRHPLWQACERTDAMLVQFQYWVATQALVVHRHGRLAPDQLAIIRSALAAALEAQVWDLTQGGKAKRRLNRAE